MPNSMNIFVILFISAESLLCFLCKTRVVYLLLCIDSDNLLCRIHRQGDAFTCEMLHQAGARFILGIDATISSKA